MRHIVVTCLLSLALAAYGCSSDDSANDNAGGGAGGGGEPSSNAGSSTANGGSSSAHAGGSVGEGGGPAGSAGASDTNRRDGGIAGATEAGGPGAAPEGGSDAGATTAFFDDFTGASLGNDWLALNRHGDYGNNELQCYSPSNATIAAGNLVITAEAHTQMCGDSTHAAASFNYRSAMVQSRWSRLYGTIEVRAKVTGGRGVWPAIWMLGTNCQATQIDTADSVGACHWPDAGSDEIDFVEVLNSDFTHVNQQIHSLGHNDGCAAVTTDVSQNFHVYQIIWAKGSLTWKIDGVQTCKIAQNVPTTPMFLIINAAVGGVGGGTVVDGTLPQSMQIDYVRVTSP